MNKLITTLEIDGKITKEPARISQEQTVFTQNLYSEKKNLNGPNYQSALMNYYKTMKQKHSLLMKENSVRKQSMNQKY